MLMLQREFILGKNKQRKCMYIVVKIRNKIHTRKLRVAIQVVQFFKTNQNHFSFQSPFYHRQFDQLLLFLLHTQIALGFFCFIQKQYLVNFDNAVDFSHKPEASKVSNSS